MGNHHDHSHNKPLKNINRAFIIGIVLNLLFVIIEATTGFLTNSLALLSDAGHNLSDVASLVLSLIAFRLMKVKPNNKYTYGFRKATILVALLNAIILLVAIATIVYEAVLRFNNPQPLQGSTIAIVAILGIIINSVTAYLFLQDKEKDINVKSAYLHLAADALVSLGVVIGGIILIYTQWLWLDSVISLVIAAVVLVSTWGLLTESLRLSLDGVPKNVDITKIKSTVLALPNVKDFYHIHIWATSTTQNALTAHITLGEAVNTLQEMEAIKEKVKHELEHLNIHHVTIEIEMPKM